MLYLLCRPATNGCGDSLAGNMTGCLQVIYVRHSDSICCRFAGASLHTSHPGRRRNQASRAAGLGVSSLVAHDGQVERLMHMDVHAALGPRSTRANCRFTSGRTTLLQASSIAVRCPYLQTGKVCCQIMQAGTAMRLVCNEVSFQTRPKLRGEYARSFTRA
jgi:hypothetical protein